MDFQQASQYLLSLGNEVAAMKLGLESMSKLLHALGDPHNKYLKVQVAGTNGKGSVCAFLEAICLSAGIKTGVTTSPHLISITERVRINGKPIIEEEFAGLATHVREIAEKLVADSELENVPTYFEQVTAISLLAFAEAGVDLAVLETGLGGRLDATTATNAEIAVITRIDIDHQKYLGTTLPDIAAEKAAIVRPKSEVVVSEQTDEALEIVLERCYAMGIKPHLAKSVSMNCESGTLTFETENVQYEVRALGLRGEHQIENAKVAILTAEILQHYFPVTQINIIAGLEYARHAGRLEFQERYLFDGAHNVGGAKALRRFVEDEIRKPITLIFGVMREKNIEEIAACLFPIADRLILTEPNNTRAERSEKMACVASKFTDKKIFQTASVAEALELAEKISPADSVILVTGSLYLVGEVQQILAARSAV